MSRFNTNKKQSPQVNQPIVSVASPTARTGNNAPGFVRDAKSELFLLAVSNFVGQDKFYESGKASDNRFRDLVRQVAQEDPAWITRFLPWLRNEANMRTASIVGAIHAARMMLVTKRPGGRQLLASVLQRADEPGEALAFYMQEYGRNIPKPIKRGIADAATRLYNEFNTLKYDTASHGIRFGDVLELTHARPYPSRVEGETGWAPRQWQQVLFKHLIDRRHGRDGIPSSLNMLHKNKWFREQAARGHWDRLLDPEHIKAAGMTWEDVLSLVGNARPKNEVWEAMIPNMGYMALLRNLRNFDEAGVSNAVAETVARRLSSLSEVFKSRQLPMRFLSAFRNVSNVRWHYPLEQALQHSLSNIPEFPGRTLILIDTSGSMNTRMSDRSELQFWDAAAIFGLALSQRCESANVYSFSNSVMSFPLQKGASLLVMLEAFKRNYLQNGGTDTLGAIRSTYSGHDRVVILTDEQANWHGGFSIHDPIPAHVPAITFNLAGYRVGHGQSGTPTRITIGGLSDACFKLLPVLEHRAQGHWPF